MTQENQWNRPVSKQKTWERFNLNTLQDNNSLIEWKFLQ